MLGTKTSRALSRALISVFALTAMLAGTNASARSYNVDFDRDRQMINEAVQLVRQHNFHAATYKLRIVKIDLMKLPGHDPDKQQLLMAVDLSLEKLIDPYLSAYEKIDFVEDCSRVAKTALVRLKQKYGNGGHGNNIRVRTLSDVIRVTRVLEQKVQRNDMYGALAIIKKMTSVLVQYDHDVDIQAALDAVDLIAEKLQDPYLALHQKIAITKDCSEVVRDKIEGSHAYGGYGGGVQRIYMGKTQGFANNIYDTEVLYTGGTKKVKKLIITAKKNTLALDQVRITFGNGQSQWVNGRVLYKGQSMKINLQGNMRFVKQILMKGTTNSAWGPQAKALVEGIR